MKRPLTVLLAVVPLAAVGLAAPAQADASVTVCHVTASNVPDSNNRYTWYVGHEIEVSENAVAALVRRSDWVAPAGYTATHPTYMRPDHVWWGGLDDVDGRLVNADCAFRFLP